MSDDVRVGVIPGDGAVVRRGDMVVVIGGTAAVPIELVEQLTAAMTGHTGTARVRAVARVALDHPEPPPLAAVVLGGERTAFVLGELDLVRGAERQSGTDHVLGVSARLADDEQFGICPSGEPLPELAAWNRLDDGTVRGDGIVVTPVDAVAAAEAAPDDEEGEQTGEMGAVPAPEPGPVAPGAGRSGSGIGAFEPLSLADDGELAAREPLPIAGADEPGAGAGDDEVSLMPYERPVQVIGVYSPRGFFNHPDARYCSRTGVKMGASHTRVLVEGTRPPLGVLTLDDGTTLGVQWDTVVGRDPSIDARVAEGAAFPFVVTDDARTVSRAHALLELVDWDVMISDLGSRNGTWVRTDPASTPTRLEPGERRVLHSGAVVWVGDRSFLYSEHHVR